MLRSKMSRRSFGLGAAASLCGLSLPLLLAPRVSNPASAGERLVPRHLYFEDPERALLRISPDGTMLAWLAPLDGIVNLWVAPVSDPLQARPVTRATDRPISSSFVWAWTGRHIVFFRDHGGDENWRAASVDIETGVTVPLSPERGVLASFVHRSPQRPTEMLLRHNARDKRFFDLHRVDLATGRSTLVFENSQFLRLYADNAFDLRFAERSLPDGSNQILERKEDGSWSTFAEIPLEDRQATWLASYPDRSTVFLVDSRGRDKGALFEVDLKNGDRRLLAEDKDADISSVLLHPDSERPIAAQARAARGRWHIVDESFREHFTALKHFAGRAAIELPAELSSKGKRFAAFIDRDDASGEFAVYDHERKESRSFFRARPKLDGVRLRPMQHMIIPARDGLPLPAYLTLPDAEFRNGPLMLLIHGDPHARDSWGYNSVHQWLASRGYAVLSINFRGSGGFGKAFLKAGDREWGGRMQDDLIDGVEWTIAKGYADRARLGFMGASYGGYAALTAATRTPEMFACIVDIFGISNLLSFMQTVPAHWGPFLSVLKRRLADPATEDGRAWLNERSPITHVDRIVRPLLIAQGMNDPRVVAAESEQMVRAMERRGIPVSYVTFPDEGHGWARPANRLAFYAIVEQFLAKHLGGRAEPIGNAFSGSSLTIEAGRHLIPGLG